MFSRRRNTGCNERHKWHSRRQALVVAIIATLTSLPGSAEFKGDLSPMPAGNWNYDNARHLLDRAGFGGTPEEVEIIRKLGLHSAVKRLVYFEGTGSPECLMKASTLSRQVAPPPRNSLAAPAKPWVSRLNSPETGRSSLSSISSSTGSAPVVSRPTVLPTGGRTGC